MSNLLVKPLCFGQVPVDPPVLQAPMAGFTDHAFRQIVRRFGGAGLLATEMISARGILSRERRREAREQSHNAEIGGFERLWGVADEPRPLAAQIWDNDPAALAEVGRRLVEKFRISVVDINFGCPASDVAEKARSGSYLLAFPDRVGEIVERVVAACRPAPVTTKIRLGRTRDTINAIDVAQAVEAAGAAAVTVHGRTAADGYRGTADWNEIARIKAHLRRIPLVGNGDLRTPADVLNAFDRYGIDGVMIGRAALGRPWIFGQIAAALAGLPAPPDPSVDEQKKTILAHYKMVLDQFGLTKGTILMRSFGCCYGAGRPGAREFRRLVAAATCPANFFAAVEGWCHPIGG